ncbi:MAG: carboxypeptidase M32 [Spirochaetaceae bacterium]|nr:carboxypeptidase M32 [Spirochaetaceae bacterium]
MNKKDISLLKNIDNEILLLSHTAAILGWDQETYMPQNSVEERSSQLALLSALIHEKLTSEITASIFKDIKKYEDISFEKDISENDRYFIRKIFNAYKKQSLLPVSLVKEISKQTSISQHTWAKAKEDNNYKLFKPELEKMISLQKQKAECYGYTGTPYNALLDEYEKGAIVSQIDKIFHDIELRIKNLLDKILVNGNANGNKTGDIEDSFLYGKFDVKKQDAVGRKVLEWLGFDFNSARMDTSAHPFTTTLGFSDVRITTHYKENYFPAGLYSIIHECGHALYEMGFSKELKGTSLAEGTSLGIHESQSRFWENMVGRGKGFAKLFWPVFCNYFPEAGKNRTHEDFFMAVNKVKPSLVRINADEVTYNLHIIIRYRLEKMLVEDKLSVVDLPAAWNNLYKELLDLTPDSDSTGVLQDIHWSTGAIGYFPTYLLGNLYAAQFVATMEKETGNVDDLVEAGNFKIILDWLRNNIHKYGALYTPDELVQKVTEQPLDPSYFLVYLDKKYR